MTRLKAVELQYRKTRDAALKLQALRNETIREALAAGITPRQACEITDLSKARISQIIHETKEEQDA